MRRVEDWQNVKPFPADLHLYQNLRVHLSFYTFKPVFKHPELSFQQSFSDELTALNVYLS
jgi:hypothetical protein